jgi:hypothetical protein
VQEQERVQVQERVQEQVQEQEWVPGRRSERLRVQELVSAAVLPAG